LQNLFSGYQSESATPCGPSASGPSSGGRGAASAFLQACLSAFLAAGFALALYGPRVVDPASVHWLLHGDPAQHLLGAASFISEPWHWPPGLIAGGTAGVVTASPAGGSSAGASSIVFTDAIPLLALAGKLLGWPAHWQYFGLWMLACHALAAWWGVRLLMILGAPAPAALAGSLLFAMAPAMLLRAYGHEALMAHWLVLAALALSLVSWRPRAWLLLSAVALLTHAYLAAMVLALWLAKGASVQAWKTLLAGLLVLGGIAWLAGYGVGGRQLSAGGFGFFSANLLSWFDPMDWADFLTFHGRDTAHTGEWSALLPPLSQATRGQYEGFAYMGAGVIALMLLAVLLVLSQASLIARLPAPIFSRPSVTIVPLWLWGICIAMAAFALSARPSIGSWIVVEIPLPGFLDRLAGVFRSSGRFIWPLGYLLMAVVIAIVARCGPRGGQGSSRIGLALLLAALLVQAVDLRPKLAEFHQRFAHGQQQLEELADDPAWVPMFRACPRLHVIGGGADATVTATAQLAVVMRALALGVPVQTAIASARPADSNAPASASASAPATQAGPLAPDHVWRGDTVYLVAMNDEGLRSLISRTPADMQTHTIDGYRLLHGPQCAAQMPALHTPRYGLAFIAAHSAGSAWAHVWAH
jgi:hypothetical protein